MKMNFLPYENGFSPWVKMDFHPMGIGFPRIYGDELSVTYFGELPKKRTFYRGN